MVLVDVDHFDAAFLDVRWERVVGLLGFGVVHHAFPMAMVQLSEADQRVESRRIDLIDEPILDEDHVVEPDYIVNLKTIPGLDYINEERGGFRIGALAKLADVEEHPAIREKLLILSDAAGDAASPQIRNAGTLAGNRHACGAISWWIALGPHEPGA